MIVSRTTGRMILLLNLIFILSHVESFISPLCTHESLHQNRVIVRSTTRNDELLTGGGTSALDKNTQMEESSLLRRDRYVATNRFAVRQGQEAKFEQRWANRKSRLATLDGFKYFHLMRRVKFNGATLQYDEGTDDKEALGNYISFTIWEKKSHFSAWRKSDAFIEAHGGTSIAAFMSTMINSAFVMRGPPRPAFYDGLLFQSTKPTQIYELTEGGWRVPPSTSGRLPTECFVTYDQFYIPQENAISFEHDWANNQESRLQQSDGFIAFSLMRRDGTAKGHGIKPVTIEEPTFVVTTIWKDVESFQKSKQDKIAPNQSQLWSRAPKSIFYEATLVISSPNGA